MPLAKVSSQEEESLGGGTECSWGADCVCGSL